MQCEIYKGRKKADTYIFLESPADFEKIPESIRNFMGELTLVMNLELSSETRLACETPEVVTKNIEDQGFHIQLPPSDFK